MKLGNVPYRVSQESPHAARFSLKATGPAKDRPVLSDKQARVVTAKDFIVTGLWSFNHNTRRGTGEK